MNLRNSLFLVTLFGLLGCSKSEITVPPGSDASNLVNTTPTLPFTGGATIKSLEGIYKLSDGSTNLGTQFVCKVSKYKVSFFSNNSGIFIILNYGYASDGSIQFAGFWRYSELTTQGNIQFSVSAADATNVLKGVMANVKLQGAFSAQQLTLQYDKNFTPYTTSNEFMVFAHHGVQTYANPPYAENSLKGILNAGDYGVNGAELDVRMTLDNVPILIHDPTINTRLTKKGPLFGYWDQYSFPFISEYVRLIDGQRVPSVEQALKTIIDSTTLKYVWLDIKGNPGIFKYLEPVIRNASAYAITQNRGDLKIFAGLPSSPTIDELNTTPTYKGGNPAYSYSDPLLTLAEETLDKAIATKSQYFGPRYTVGLLLDDVEKAHANGIKVISWTLNSKAIITNYLKNGKFDGFITDYPSYVVHDYYTMF